jgi:hypothetical protein
MINFNLYVRPEKIIHFNCKTGTVCGGVLVGWGRVNRGDEGEGTWLMGFIHKYDIEQ